MKITKFLFLGFLSLAIITLFTKIHANSLNNKLGGKNSYKNKFISKERSTEQEMENENMESEYKNFKAIKYYMPSDDENDIKKSVKYIRPIFTNDNQAKNNMKENSKKVIEDIEEVETNKLIRSKGDDYYDGSRKLTYYSNICHGFSKNLDECNKLANCGWCFSSNKCIHGNKEGPVESCNLRHFFFRGELI